MTMTLKDASNDLHACIGGVGYCNLQHVADAIDARLAGMGEPEFKAISDHWVHRGVDSLPCYCWAGNDHAIGDEKARPAPPTSADMASLQSRVAEQDAEIARLQEQLHAGTEAGWHALRNEGDDLQSRLAAANALVAEWRTRVPAGASDTPRVLMRECCADQLEAAIDAHLQGAGDE